MFYILPARIMHDKTLSADSKLLLAYLISTCDWEEKHLEINSESLSQIFNSSVKNVRKNLIRLDALGFINLCVNPHEDKDVGFYEGVTILDRCFESGIDKYLRSRK